MRIAFTLISMLGLAGCTPSLVLPDDGERATLVVPTDGKSASFHLYRESIDCSEPQISAQGPDLADGRFEIPAGREISVGTITDALINPMGVFLGHARSRQMCRLVFTFTPEAGETYVISEAQRATDCQYEVHDSQGRTVPVTKRVPTGGHLQSWCEETPKKSAN